MKNSELAEGLITIISENGLVDYRGWENVSDAVYDSLQKILEEIKSTEAE